MVFGVADYGNADSEFSGGFALGDVRFGVVSAFGVDVGAESVEEIFDVGLIEDGHVVDAAKGGNESGAG